MATPQELLQMARQAGVQFPDLPPALQEAVASGRMDEATARQRALKNRPQYRQAMGLPASPEDAAIAAAGGSGSPAQPRAYPGGGAFQPTDAQRAEAEAGGRRMGPGARDAMAGWSRARGMGRPPGSGGSADGPAGEVAIFDDAPSVDGVAGSPFVRMGVPVGAGGERAPGGAWNSGGLPGGGAPAVLGAIDAGLEGMRSKLPAGGPPAPAPGGMPNFGPGSGGGAPAAGPSSAETKMPMPNFGPGSGAGANAVKPRLSDLAELAGGPPGGARATGGSLQGSPGGPAPSGGAASKPQLTDLASVGAGMPVDPAAENRRRLMEQRKAASVALGI